LKLVEAPDKSNTSTLTISNLPAAGMASISTLTTPLVGFGEIETLRGFSTEYSVNPVINWHVPRGSEYTVCPFFLKHSSTR
jgi:hypothetical protein